MSLIFSGAGGRGYGQKLKLGEEQPTEKREPKGLWIKLFPLLSVITVQLNRRLLRSTSETMRTNPLSLKAHG